MHGGRTIFTFRCFGPSFLTRRGHPDVFSVGDPLLALDPIFLATLEDTRTLIPEHFASTLDLTQPNYALGYEFDIVLRGRSVTPMEA